jgi:hypothetical protein
MQYEDARAIVRAFFREHNVKDTEVTEIQRPNGLRLLKFTGCIKVEPDIVDKDADSR